MRTQRLVRTATSLGLLLAVVLPVQAAEIRVLGALALKPALEELVPQFNQASGHKVVVTFATLGDALKRVQAGDGADVAVLPRDGIDALVKDARANASSVVPIATSGNGVAVRKGVVKPDISTPDALRRALLAARSISYTPPKFGGTSGPHIVRIFERLGIAEEMNAKSVFPEVAGGAAVGALVASGQAEIGLQQIQELVPVAGIEVVGPLPGELQNNIVFSAAIMAGAGDMQDARSLIEFLRSAQAAAVFKAKGMEPAAP